MDTFFCLDVRVQAGEFDVDSAYDDETVQYEQVVADEWMFPAFRVMPMGWTWALWLCQSSMAGKASMGSPVRARSPRLWATADRHLQWRQVFR